MFPIFWIQHRCFLQVSRIVAYVGFNGRFDHIMANVNTLYKASELTNIPVYLINEDALACLLQEVSQRNFYFCYSSFTLPDTETDTYFDKICTEPNGNLHWFLSLSSINTCTQFYRSNFLSVWVSVVVSFTVNTPLTRTDLENDDVVILNVIQ